MSNLHSDSKEIELYCFSTCNCLKTLYSIGL